MLISHHAYFLVGEEGGIVAELRAAAPADWWYHRVSTFGIEDSRALRSQQLERPAGEERFFIIVTELLTVEAQNALLKMLEEPTPGNRFFFIIPSAGFLLPTLVSRAEVIHHDQLSPTDLVPQFVTAPPSTRLKLVGELVTRRQALDFVISLSRWSEKSAVLKTTPATWARVVEELIRTEAYLQKTGSAPKLVLEHLALIWPRAK